MRISCILFLMIGLSFMIGCGNADKVSSKDSAEPAVESTTKIVDQIVEASCGECQFGMEGNGCNLAVQIDGQSYYVDGSSIDGHGDAHGDEGLCNCIRQAKVTGEIKDGRFVATSFEVLPKGG